MLRFEQAWRASRAGLVLLLLLGAPGGWAQGAPAPEARNLLLERRARAHPQWSAAGIVAAQEPLAAAAGAALLRRGGNAVDGAVATAFALAVTHPMAGNLGGGGFAVLWLPGPSPAAARGCLAGLAMSPERRLGAGTAVAVDFRERAPLAARADLFLRADGQVDRQRATGSAQSVAVPGSVAGLLLLQRCYGRLPRAQVLAPAITLARRGFRVNRELADSLAAAAPRLQWDSVTPQLPRAGHLWRQPALAAVLERVARQGEQGFYRGPLAEALLAWMVRQGGLLRRADLLDPPARLVPPLQTRLLGHPLLTVPLPAGGPSLAQLLSLVEPMDLAATGPHSAASFHLLAEAMNLVFRDRNTLLGDPLRKPLAVTALLDPQRQARLRQQIDRQRHRPAAELGASPPLNSGGSNTTHLSVADRQGGLVALTTSLNHAYGSGLAVPGTGVLLNNTMDDFTASPGSANSFGLRQGSANAIAPGARPLSSMAPILVFRPDGRSWLATGSPGGSRILSTVAQVLLNRIVHGLNLAEAVLAPRVHSQLWPDELAVEEGISSDTLRLLQAMGHRLSPAPAMGAANSVEVLRGSRGEPAGSLGFTDLRRAEGPAVPE